MTLPDPAGLAAADAAIPGGLLARLQSAAYTPETFARAEREVPTVLGAGRLPLIQDALAAGVPGGVAVALFCYQIPQPLAEAERALGADAVAACRRAGVITGPDDALRSPWRIVPFLGTYVASDHPDAGSEAVMGPGPTTTALAQASLPASGARVLDLGCGAGSLALAAMRGGAAAACAIDINPRAVAVAAINAGLNRLALDCRAGDLLAPVAGERFDLIMSQPPYVIRPPGSAGVTYLHAGGRGDELARRILAEAPAHLAPGGLAVVHFDGPADRDGSMVRELARAAREPVDIAVLVERGVPVAVQAMSYAALIHSGFTAAYADAVRAYLGHCRATGLSEFGRYLVALRRSARGWGVRIPLSGARHLLRPELDRLIAGFDLAEAPEAEVLARRVAPLPDAELVLRRPFGGPEITRIGTAYGESPLPGHEIDEPTAGMCDLLAAAATVSGAVTAYAEQGGSDRTAALAAVLPFVRDGLRRGVLAVG